VVFVIAVIRNLVIRAGADFSQMRREMQKAQKDLQDFGSKMKTALGALGAALGGIAIGMGIKDAIDDAIKVEAAMQQVNRMMGSSALEFSNWAKESSAAFNMSRSEAIRYGAIFSNLVGTFATDTAKTADYTKQLLKSSAIIAAATGRDMEDVMQRIRSGMLGNTEAVEDLGVNVQVSMMESTDAFKKFANGKSWEQLDFKVKSQILMFGILEQATKKYGDEMANNTASRIGAFTTQLKNAKLSLGQAFLPIVNIILPSLTAFASALARVMSLVAQFSQALFGKSIVSSAKATDAQAGAVGGLGDAYDEAGKKAKKAANSLAGFDEINSLGSGNKDDETDDAGLGANVDLGIGGGIGEATDEVSSKVREMADKVKKAFGEMSAFIVQHKEIIIAALYGIAAAFATLAVVKSVSLLLQGIGAAISLILSPIGLLVIAIAALAGAFTYFYRNNEGFRDKVNAIWEEIKVSLSAAWDWIVTAAKATWKGLEQFWATNGDAIIATFKATWEGIKTFLTSTFNFINTISLAIWGGMQAFWQRWGEDITRIFTSIWKTISSLMVDISKFIVEKLKVLAAFWNEYWPDIAKALINAWKVIWYFLEPFVGGIIKGLQMAWETFATLLTAIWADIKQIVSGVLDVIMGIVKIFIGVFTLNWSTLWDGIKQTTKGATDAVQGVISLVFDTIGGIIVTAASFIYGVYIGMMETLRDNSKKMWEGISGVISNVWDGIKDNIKNSINAITAMINNFIDKFNGIKISIPSINIPGVGPVGGFELGMPQIPRIPMLKRGGIVDGETNMGNYIAGEAGAEMIVPLENTSFVDKVASALGTAVLTAMQMGGGNKGGNGSKDINLIIDGTSIARAIAPYLNKENSRIGGAMITTG
jgi:phage-related protein